MTNFQVENKIMDECIQTNEKIKLIIIIIIKKTMSGSLTVQ